MLKQSREAEREDSSADKGYRQNEIVEKSERRAPTQSLG